MKKKVLALVVLAAMLISILPMAAFAAVTTTYTLKETSAAVKAGEAATITVVTSGTAVAAEIKKPELEGVTFGEATLNENVITITATPVADVSAVYTISVKNADDKEIGTFTLTAYTEGKVTPYGGGVTVTTAEADVVVAPSKDEDGVEFEVVVVTSSDKIADGEKIYVASNREAVDKFYYKDAKDEWVEATSGAIPVPAGSKSAVVEVKAVSSIAGSNVKVAFSTKDQADAYAYVTGAKDSSSVNIIDAKTYSVAFTTAGATKIEFTKTAGFDKAYANNIDTVEVSAYVTSAGYPAAGKEVTFSIVKGTGASLSATTATTNAAGKATVKVYSSKPGDVEIQAKTGDVKTGTKENGANAVVTFSSTGIVSIKAESDDNQKIARNGDKDVVFKYSAYDANGNKVLLAKGNAALDEKEKQIKDSQVSIVTKPSGSNLKDDHVVIGYNADGLATVSIPRAKLDKDGDYEIRYYLVNGSSVSYKFSAKKQGDITAMELKYGSDSYSAEAAVPSPELKYLDAEGYATTVESGAFDSSVKFTISDASFLAAGSTTFATKGNFTLEDKTGVVTMTAIDTDKDLVATQVLNIQKAASSLKLTAPNATAAGKDAEIKIQLVDADGKPAASGKDADSSASKAIIVSKPTGAIVTVDDVDVDDFAKGEASVKVTSYVAGTVKVQVIIAEAGSTKVYTGSTDVVFGEGGAVEGNQVIFMIGSSSYVVDGQPVAGTSVPFIENGRTYLGVRDMAYAMGISDDFVKWDQATQTASITKNGITVEVTVGASAIKVTKDNVTTEVAVDAPAQNKDGRVFLPFRAVFTAFGYEVEYSNGVIVCK